MIAAAHVHTIKEYGPDRVARLLADPGDVDGVVRRRVPVHRADRRGDDVVLRLVRRPAGGLAAGVRRPDRCAGVRGLVGRVVSDDVGLQRPGHPHARRALDGRGSLPRNESASASAPTTPTTRSSPTSGCRARRAPTARSAMAMGHVILSECFVQQAGSVLRRLCAALHRSAVPGQARGARRCAGAREEPHRRRPRRRRCGVENAAFKPVLLDGATDTVAVPKGSLGFRYGDDGVGKWNLELGDLVPALTVAAPGGRDRAGAPAALRHDRRARRDAGAGRAGAAGRRAPRCARCST